MAQPLDYLKETASQTAGPYVHIGLIPDMAGFDIFEKNFANVLVNDEHQGRAHHAAKAGCSTAPARRCATCCSRSGRPMRPAATIIRPIARPAPIDEDFRGWGRAGSDFETGLDHLRDHQAGRDRRQGGPQMAPHVNVWIVARGINIGLNTRIYFSDEEAANAADPVLNLIEQPVRRIDADRQAQRARRQGRVLLHHQSAGAGRDGVLRRLRRHSSPPWSCARKARGDRPVAAA